MAEPMDYDYAAPMPPELTRVVHYIRRGNLPKTRHHVEEALVTGEKTNKRFWTTLCRIPDYPEQTNCLSAACLLLMAAGERIVLPIRPTNMTIVRLYLDQEDYSLVSFIRCFRLGMAADLLSHPRYPGTPLDRVQRAIDFDPPSIRRLWNLYPELEAQTQIVADRLATDEDVSLFGLEESYIGLVEFLYNHHLILPETYPAILNNGISFVFNNVEAILREDEGEGVDMSMNYLLQTYPGIADAIKTCEVLADVVHPDYLNEDTRRMIDYLEGVGLPEIKTHVVAAILDLA